MDFRGSFEKGDVTPGLAREKSFFDPGGGVLRICQEIRRFGKTFSRGIGFARHLDRGLHRVGPVLETLGPGARSRMIQRYLESLLNSLEISIFDRRTFPYVPTPCLVVSNHLSWLDPVILGRLFPARFVSKSDVARWPLLGAMAKFAGTIMIDRGRAGSVLETIDRMEKVLKGGETVCWFPEGTTGNGDRLGNFSSGLFEVAIRTGIPVLPVALFYPNPFLVGNRPDQNPCVLPVYDAPLYHGRRSFMGSLARILHRAPFSVIVRTGPLLSPLGRTRQELSRHAREEILGLLPATPSSSFEGTEKGKAWIRTSEDRD